MYYRICACNPNRFNGPSDVATVGRHVERLSIVRFSRTLDELYGFLKC